MLSSLERKYLPKLSIGAQLKFWQRRVMDADELADEKRRWEWITRRLLVLASYGFHMEYFDKYVDLPDFLTDGWLEDWYGGQLPDYAMNELHEVDRKVS